LLALSDAGVEDVCIVVGYRAEEIEGYFGDGSALGINISCVCQQEQKGTGDAVSCVNDWTEPFLVLNGDIIVDSEHVRRVMDGNGDAVVSIREMPNPQQMGVVETKNDSVVRITEKSSRPPSSMANAGIYRFTPEVFEALGKCRLSPRGEIELTDAVNRLVDSGQDVRAIVVEGDWMDAGFPWDLLAANEAVLARESPGWKRKPSGAIVEPNISLNGPVITGENTRIRSGTYIEGPVIIGRECDIGPNCYIRGATAIGDGVRIGNAVEVKNSIIMNDTHIGHLSYVGDSVIGRDCNFGAGTKTANLRLDRGNVPVLSGGEIMDSGREKLGVIMGDGVSVGINCSLDCGAVINTGARVPPHTLVDRDWILREGG
jgi:bifunctional UDP-N-acetylglucosamine pyrophosphorylase/glucosamine-1-phosphate N-acetyltransferase